MNLTRRAALGRPPKLEKTATPGIFRRHVRDCARSGRCDCAYTVVWRHRGKQLTETFPTFAQAREAKASRDAGDRRPVDPGRRRGLLRWLDRVLRRAHGARLHRDIALAVPAQHHRPRHVQVGTWRLAEVEPGDVRELFASCAPMASRHRRSRGLRAALSAMFATAVEDGLLRSNPVQGVRIPTAIDHAEREERAKALTRAELALVLAAVPAEWRLFFEFLAHTGLRISEAIGITWAHLDLGTRPRVIVREQVYRGRAPPAQVGALTPRHPALAGMAAPAARPRRDSYRGEPAPVFATATGAELSRPNVAGRVLEPAAEGVGLPLGQLPHLQAHLRVAAVRGRRNVKQVQEWLGHADPGFTFGPTSTCWTRARRRRLPRRPPARRQVRRLD